LSEIDDKREIGSDEVEVKDRVWLSSEQLRRTLEILDGK
jgi:hypothetical protein